MRKPCKTCPWRRDSKPGHWDPEHFREIWVGCQDDGPNLMLCHKAGVPTSTSPKIVCQGWVRVLKFDAIGVRIAVMQDLVTEEEMNDVDGPDLFASFREMLDANGVRPPPRNRYVRRLPR